MHIHETQLLGERQTERAAFDESRFVAAFIAMLACALIFGVMIRLQAVSGSNDGSRWNTVWSLINGRGYVIDDAPFLTIDKVRRGGHYYSSKPPLMPTLVAAPAWLVEWVTGLRIPQHSYVIHRLLLTFFNIIPFALFIYFYTLLLERQGAGFVTRLFCTGAAAFGTYLTAYSATLNNHTQAAIAAFLALYCLIRIHYDGKREWYYFALCGAFTAWTVVNEMVALVFALLVMGWLLRRYPRPTLKFFVPVAALFGAAYLLTVRISTGGYLPYYVYFNTEYYQYEGGYWRRPRGVDAAHEPKWFYALNLLVGHHGIFSLTPIFLIGVYGMIKDRGLRAIHALGLFLSAAMFIFYVFKTNNYGGVCQGARWLFWLIPFWLLGLAPAVERNIRSRGFRIVALALLALSLMSVGHALSGNRDVGRPGPWSASWVHTLMRNAGWITY